jgi:cobalt-zinc-cadmium efflux system outer membrane protein
MVRCLDWFELLGHIRHFIIALTIQDCIINSPSSRSLNLPSAQNYFLSSAGLVAMLLFTLSAHAQTVHDALESAWSRQPAQRAQTARLAEIEGRRKAANALTPEPAALSMGQRTDRTGSNAGRRELELEVAVPLWLAGQRDRQRAVVEAESNSYGAAQALGKWRLAGEVRDAWWQARLAEAERDVAGQRLESATALANDVARRVNAGDLARVDANRARAAEQAARITLGAAEARAFRLLQQFTALTGLATLPSAGEQPPTLPAEIHPQRIAVQQRAALAQKRVDYAGVTRRDPPELSVALTRERSTFEERFDNSIMLRLKVPFATDARNQPRIAAAAASQSEADAALLLESSSIEAGIAGARRESEQAQITVRLSESRFELARDTHQLLDRAFQLGELDLPARLLAEAERYEAERNLVKARLEAGHAISNLNQALGLLP